MFLWRENSGGFHAEVVVLNHPTGSVSNPKRILAGISDFNFILAQNHLPAALWCQPQIALAAVGWQTRSLLLHLAEKMAGQKYLKSLGRS
jgi:hypothetical protein